MKKYLVVVDLDGTLLNDNNEISDYNKLILKKCQKNGCKIAISTSRSYIRTISFEEEINADYTICFNGNYVVGDKVIYKNTFEQNILINIIDTLEENKYNFIIECLKGTYRNFNKENKLIQSNYIKLNDMKKEECFKFLVECSPLEVIDLMQKFSKYNLTLSYDKKNKFMRIMPSETEKWNGLTKLELDKYNLISFGNDSTDFLTLKKSYLGIKMQNSDNSLETINFSTKSNNENGVGKFLNNYFNFDVNSYYENIKILDCTLRDGGHLNNSLFGEKVIKNIISNLSKSNIDVIEIGFLEDCKYNENRACFSSIEEAEMLLKNINTKNSLISVLTQVDKFNINNLTECVGKVKMIRVSFHSDLIKEGMEYCKGVLEKGYLCSCNPINFSNYTNQEIINLIKEVNLLNPTYFCIVDTFGIMLNNDFLNKINLLDNLLNKDIKLGLHLHNNLSSSFSTAQILIQTKSRFNDIIIDTSLNGMGRAPGNLKTELLTYYLNFEKKNKYNLKYIYDLIESDIKTLSKNYNWDLNFIYSISAFEKVHRTYAEYLIDKNINFIDAQKIIKRIPEEHRGRYDPNIIEKLYKKHFKEV